MPGEKPENKVRTAQANEPSSALPNRFPVIESARRRAAWKRLPVYSRSFPHRWVSLLL